MTVQTTWRCHAQIIAEPGVPSLHIDTSAYLPCGCTVHIGHRLDNHEAATGAVACSPAHRTLIARFNELYAATLAPDQITDRPAIDVAAETLEHASTEHHLMTAAERVNQRVRTCHERVECPRCGAPPGFACRSLQASSRRLLKHSHEARVRADGTPLR